MALHLLIRNTLKIKHNAHFPIQTMHSFMLTCVSVQTVLNFHQVQQSSK